MQKLKIFAAVAVIILLAASTLGSTFYLSSGYLERGDSQKPVPCKIEGSTHELSIRGNRFDVENLHAIRCDTLTVRNLDEETRLIAFGRHDHHRVYDGVTERLLKKGEGFTITLNEAGSFTIHDHLHDEVEGLFVVSQ